MKCILIGDLLQIKQTSFKDDKGTDVPYTLGFLFDIDSFKDTDKIFTFSVDQKVSTEFVATAQTLLNKAVQLTGYLTTREGDRKFKALEIKALK